MNSWGEWATYAADVIEGRQVVGHYVKRAVETFMDDLTRTDWEWRFDATEAQRWISFVGMFCKHTRGEWAGRPFLLSPWQQFFVANLFGWKNKDGVRRYRTAFLYVARKSGKTQLAAALAIAQMILDDDAAGEFVFAATKRDQARIGFDEVRRMIEANPTLRRRFRVRRHDILAPRDGVCKPLSSDSNTMDGLSLNLGIVDELHGMRDGGILRVIKSSQGARKNPLTLAITTAGFNVDGIAATIMKTAKDVLDGVKTDDRTFALLYELDSGDDWKDPEVWIKANPGLGESISEQFLFSQCKQAQNHGGRAVVEFQTKHCNQFVSSQSRWIEREVWKANESERQPLPESVCFAGLDLASVSDMSALALLFPQPDGDFILEVHYFVPERAIERRLELDESDLYGQLSDLSNVHITPGNVTDYGFIRRFLTGHHLNDEGRVLIDRECVATKYNLRSLAFDRYNSSQLITDLVGDGLTCAPFGQGFVSMSAPTKQFERVALDGGLLHRPDPVLDWMLENVALAFDPAGNIKVTKQKSGGKVDGIVAAIMALGEFMTFDDDDTRPPLPDDLEIRIL
jgi:phage terminase large subunit-like protein